MQYTIEIMNNNQAFNSSGYNFNSLPRSSSSMASSVNNTPTSSTNRALPPRAGFGTSNYMLKEDYEKERTRWQKELTDAEAKLAQFSLVNNELAQTKAQLNKKIVDIEKNQKPMVECNRRLAERNKTLMDSCKNLEETLSFIRDEKLTLKDQYDRVLKENFNLKEQRAFPEKLEELERYRNQVLEYSKCITALRQSLVEKDRRHELLVQKLRKIKKALSVRRDDDEQSERSVGSSIALDTIAEDLSLDEDSTLLVSSDIQPTMYEQLEVANTVINELRLILGVDCNIDDKSACLISKVMKLQEENKVLGERQQMLELELENARDSSDLFEFQLVELTSAKAQLSFCEQACETDEFLPVSAQTELEVEPKLNFDDELVGKTKASLHQLCKLFALTPIQRRAVGDGIACVSGLERKLTFAQTQLDTAQCEIKRMSKVIEENTVELRKKTEVSSETSSQKKKELKATVERLKSEMEKQSRELNALQKKVDSTKRQLADAEVEKENFRYSLEESTEKINEVVESLQKANVLVEDYKQRLKTNGEHIKTLEQKIHHLEEELKRADLKQDDAVESDVKRTRSAQLKSEKLAVEDEISRLCAQTVSPNLHSSSDSAQQLAMIQRKLCNYEDLLQSANKSQLELQKKLDIERREVVQLRNYNKQLEAQFNSQMDMIVELRKRYLDLNAKKNESSKSHESISWTSSGSSDEQYHTEETRSEEAYDVVPKKVVA